MDKPHLSSWELHLNLQSWSKVVRQDAIFNPANEFVRLLGKTESENLEYRVSTKVVLSRKIGGNKSLQYAAGYEQDEQNIPYR